MRTGAALLASLAWAGCLACSVTAEWERIEDPHFVAEDGSYSLELPLGWMRAENPDTPDGCALTRDGWEAQLITFNAGAVLETADALAIDPAAPELLTAMQEELAAQPGVEVIDCRSITLDALPGFRMHFTQEAPVDLEGNSGAPAGSTEMVLYLAVEGATLYAFSFLNSRPATFERDLEVFERMVASFARRERAQSGP